MTVKFIKIYVGNDSTVFKRIQANSIGNIILSA